MNNSVLVKICGLTNLRDAEFAVSACADCIGFVLVPESPRYVSPARLQDWLSDLPGTVTVVAVIANRPLRELRKLLDHPEMDILQLHGDETADFAHNLPRDRIWRAVHLRTLPDVERAAGYPAAALVADTATAGRRGGTGQVGDWKLARDLARRTHLILAGGLTPENVAKAVRQVQPFGVDVSSGVEAVPGRKDPARVRDFIQAAKQERPKT